jgi:hypothetical protein
MKWLVKSKYTGNYVQTACTCSLLDSVWTTRQRDALRFCSVNDARTWIKAFKKRGGCFGQGIYRVAK